MRTVVIDCYFKMYCYLLVYELKAIPTFYFSFLRVAVEHKNWRTSVACVASQRQGFPTHKQTAFKVKQETGVWIPILTNLVDAVPPSPLEFDYPLPQ